MRILSILLLLTVPALAQNDDEFWQQIVANRAVQCDVQTKQLLKTLDEQKKQITDLQKQLDELKKK